MSRILLIAASTLMIVTLFGGVTSVTKKIMSPVSQALHMAKSPDCRATDSCFHK